MILSRCPNCDTVFRVTPEQLAARQGMVRCGRCGTAFSALGALVTPPPAPTAAPDEPGPDTASPGAAPPAAAHEPPPPPEDGAAGAAAKPLVAFLQPQEPPVEPLLPGTAATKTDAGVSAVATADTPAAQGGAAEPANDDIGLAPPGHASPLVLATGYLRSRPVPVWTGAVILLASLAIAQSLYVFRGDIAQSWPGARPLLESFCAPFGCRVELPRQADLIGIEVSDLHPDPEHRDRLILAATLKNRAPFTQGLPHLELTLTDARDRALARRVIAPEEYLGPGAQLKGGLAANAEQSVQLLLGTGDIAASGYRLYVFYP